MKNNRKASESKKIDRERETRVLLEKMHSDIQRIAEASGQIAEIKVTVNDLLPLKSEAKTISMAVRQFSSDLKEVKNDIKNLQNKVDENLSNHEKRITKIEEKILV